ncbi:MAG TPA: selenide, water dikinase SelD [Verrucomicrobiae bacterium]|nr:selenide, water dikinase SelD [Verrucomicrobiae bacterium]
MRRGSGKVECDLVLVGGGHSHVEVLRRFAMRPEPGVRLTLISRDIETPYSGMLPGLIAGHYTHEEAHIDLRPLAQMGGARLYHTAVNGLDLTEKRIHCDGRPPVDFDYLSLDIGSRPDWQNVPGAAEHALPVKPVDAFLAAWPSIEVSLLHRNGLPPRLVVVGGGAGGTEVCLALQHRLKTARPDTKVKFAIVTDKAELLPEHNPGVRQCLTRAVRARGVELHLERRVVAVTPGCLRCATGEEIAFDVALWLTNAAPAAWLQRTGLALDERGFVAVNECLQSISHRFVFAAGDVAALTSHRLPKSGVFAVREGPPLAGNLRRACRGERMQPYRPQRHHLALISTGNKYAVASRGRWSAEGAWVWRLKDYIDRRWMRMYQQLGSMAAMPAPRNGMADAEMRCGGCGAKIGSELLARVLRRLQPETRPDVLVGLDPADDAAVVTLSGNQLLVQSVDFFRAFIDDPYLFGRIASNHCLGDLYAMGAVPQTALAIVTLPHGAEAKVEADLYQLMAGATETLKVAGAALIGGHTGEGAELAFGLTVNGTAVPGRLWRKSGLKTGDALILTKPLGTGVLFAADMRGKARGTWIDGALASMLMPSRSAAETLQRHGARACTDVTGFGLAGHLLEMLRASETSAEVSLKSLPALAGSLQLLTQGIASSLAPQNLAHGEAVDSGAISSRDSLLALLYDPQTAGGLLAGVPAESMESCLAELRTNGSLQAACIGRVTAMVETPRIILTP